MCIILKGHVLQYCITSFIGVWATGGFIEKEMDKAVKTKYDYGPKWMLEWYVISLPSLSVSKQDGVVQ